MVGLEALFQKSDPGTSMRRAKVLTVDGHTLTVDLGGAITVQAWDSCNPQVGQWVDLSIQGTTAMATGVVGGPYRQATITVTVDGPTGVAGVVNGVLVTVAKIGSFTATVGDVLPLIWSGDASGVWAGEKGSSAYVPPTGGGGGGTPPPSGGSTYTYSYAATTSGTFAGGGVAQGDLKLTSTTNGFFQYGKGRMYELHAKTIISGRIYLPRVSGSGTVSLYVATNPSFTATNTGGWATLSPTRLAELVAIDSSNPVFVTLNGTGVLKGTPAGTIQITWQ